MYAETGRLDEALKLATVAQAQLKRPEADDTLGWVYYRKGLLQHAIASFERAANKAPNNPVYQYHLGLAQLKQGNDAQGRAALKRALALKSDFNGADDARKALEEDEASAIASLASELKRFTQWLGARFRQIRRDPQSSARRAGRDRVRAPSARVGSTPRSNMRRASRSSGVSRSQQSPLQAARSAFRRARSAVSRAASTRARMRGRRLARRRGGEFAGGQRRDRDGQVHPIAQRSRQS